MCTPRNNIYCRSAFGKILHSQILLGILQQFTRRRSCAHDIQPKIGRYPKDEGFIHIDREGGFLTLLPTNQLFLSHGPGPRLSFFPEDVKFSCMPLYIPDQNNLGKTQKIWTSFTVLYTKNISFEMLKVSHIISIFIRMLHNDARGWGLSLWHWS